MNVLPGMKSVLSSTFVMCLIAWGKQSIRKNIGGVGFHDVDDLITV
jgi:hypothetical protein